MLMKDSKRPERLSYCYGYPVSAGTRLYKKALVAILAGGFAVPAGTAGAVSVVGVAENAVDNREGIDGDQRVRAVKSTFPFAFDVAPTFADIDKPVYAVDDDTVSLDGTGKLKCGVLDGIEDGQFFVRIG